MEHDDVGLARGALELCQYNPDWVEWFAAERAALLKQLPDLVLDVEHVGSTSIAGLAAKPIIDMQAALRAMSDADLVIPRLVNRGYSFMPERVYEGRIFLPKGPEERRTHYLSLIEADTEEWHLRLRFRDALRCSTTLQQDYQDLKRRLMDEHAWDRTAYTAAKSAFIARVLADHS